MKKKEEIKEKKRRMSSVVEQSERANGSSKSFYGKSRVMVVSALAFLLCVFSPGTGFSKVPADSCKLASERELVHSQIKFHLTDNFIHLVTGLKGYDALLFYDWGKPEKVDELISKDGNFVGILQVCWFNVSDSIDMKDRFNFALGVNTYHLNQIRLNQLINHHQPLSTPINRKELTYLSGDFARSAFNADTVITYPLKVWKAYKGKYKYSKVICIQKNGRGAIFIYCLLNQAGLEQFDNYLHQLSGVFVYRNPDEFVAEKKCNITEVIIPPSKKKHKPTITRIPYPF
jgi:hypothetical protein